MLQYNVAVAGMKMISNLGYLGHLDALGISRADYMRFVGDAPWLGTDRNRMTSILHSLTLGSIDALGLPRFKTLPAEFLAAAIAVFVSPVNIHVACVYAPTSGEAEILGRAGSPNSVTSEQLFALVQQLYASEERSPARALFEKKVGLAIEEAKMVISNGKQK